MLFLAPHLSILSFTAFALSVLQLTMWLPRHLLDNGGLITFLNGLNKEAVK